MPAHLLICHIMRILKFIHAAMLASEIAYVGYEQDCLQGSTPSEKTCPEKPPSKIKQLFHVIILYKFFKNPRPVHYRQSAQMQNRDRPAIHRKIRFTTIIITQNIITMLRAVSQRSRNQSTPALRYAWKSPIGPIQIFGSIGTSR